MPELQLKTKWHVFMACITVGIFHVSLHIVAMYAQPIIIVIIIAV